MNSSRWRGLKPALVAMAAAAALVLSGCSSAGSSQAGADKWTYTDALGHAVSLDHRPTRVAGLNDVIVSLLEYGIHPVASFGYSSIEDDDRFDDLDTKGITQVGTSYGEIDLTKLAEAKPDLIVTDVYPTDSKGTIDKSAADYGFKNVTQQKEIEKIAPVVTIYMGGDGQAVIDHTTELARSLGAKASVISSAKTKFDTAKTALHEAATKNDITVTAMYADPDGISVAKPEDDPALRLYTDDGVKMTAPDTKDYYWAQYSWENATKIGGDMILLEQSGYGVDELKKQPTLAANPALKAGQVHPWESSGMDYVQQAAYMDKLAGWIGASRAVSR